MASYTAQVGKIHAKFKKAVKRAKTKQSLNKAYAAHRRDHSRLLKRHLKEEEALIAKAKKALG